jgi:hypothetical protein
MPDFSDQVKTPPAQFDLTGKTVGRFVVEARLGAGGMGEVPPNGWLAVLVPTGAEDGEYALTVSTEGSGACPEAGQPKIIIDPDK